VKPQLFTPLSRGFPKICWATAKSKTASAPAIKEIPYAWKCALKVDEISSVTITYEKVIKKVIKKDSLLTS